MFQIPATMMMNHEIAVMDLSALPFLPSSDVPAGLTSGSFNQATIITATGTHMSMPMNAQRQDITARKPPMIWKMDPDMPPTAVLQLMRRSRFLPTNRSAMNEEAIGKIMPRPRPRTTRVANSSQNPSDVSGTNAANDPANMRTIAKIKMCFFFIQRSRMPTRIAPKMAIKDGMP